MGSDVNGLLQAIADEIASQKEREHLSYATLESHLRRLAAVDDLDPKKAALQVKQLVLPSKKRAWWKSPFVPIAITGIISVILSVILCVFVAPRLLNQAGTVVPAVIPTDLKLEVDNLSLPADGTSDTRIRATVLDQFGQPMPDGTPVEFQVRPSDGGAVEPNRTEVIDGYAETVFRASGTSGEVQVMAWVNPGAQRTVAINLTEITQPELSVNISSEPVQSVVRGTQVTFTFSVVNNGSVPAAQVTIFSRVPESTVFEEFSDQGWTDPDGTILWQIGELPPGQTAERMLTVVVDQNLPGRSIVTASDYGVRYGSDQEVRGQGAISLTIEEAIPTRIELAVDPPAIPADGVSTAFIIAKVFDQQGNPIADGVQADFSIQPRDLGVIQPDIAFTTHGEARATFMAGTMTGEVNVVVTIETATEMVAIDLVKRGRTSIQTHLFPSPEEDTGRLIVFQIPVGTPVELLEEIQNDFRKVAVLVWVPKDVVDMDAGGQGSIATHSQEVRVGDTPKNSLNSPDTERLLHPGALGVPVQILDDSRTDYVRIRIVGWMPVDSIGEGE